MKDILKYIFEKENLKTNALALVLILIVLTGYKILTNHFHDTDNVINRNTEASIQQAVSNERLMGSVNKLGDIIDRKIR